MEKVAENITVEIPDAMIETQCKQFLDNFKMQIAQQGIPYEQYLQLTGMSEEQLVADAKEPAERQVRMDLAMLAIIEAEKLEATDEEVEAELQKMAEQYNMELEKVMSVVPMESIKHDLLVKKATEVIYSSAKVSKAAAKKTAKAEETAEETEAPAEKPKKTTGAKKGTSKKTEE